MNTKILQTTNYKLLTTNYSTGQLLIELIITIALTSVLLPAFITGFVASREGKSQTNQRLEATALLKEADEAIRVIRESGWNNLTIGTYHPQILGSSWSLTANSQNINGFTRQIVITSVNRDSSGNITTTGGTIDPSTKKIASTVSWATPLPSKVESTTYLQRHLGNAAFLHTTQSDFNGGVHSNTQTVSTGDGAVELVQLPVTTIDYGNKFQVTATSSIGNMTSANHKTSLRFTAQESKTVSAIRVYLHAENGNSPTYRYGIQTDNPVGNVPTGTWVGNFGTLQTNSAGWKTVTLGTPAVLTAGNIYHIVVEPTGSPNPTGTNNIALRRSSPLNNLYPKNNAVDINANTLFKTSATGSWAIQNFQPIYELDFSDSTFEGNPYESNTETSIFGSNWLAEKLTVAGGDKSPQSISFYLRRNGNPPNNLTVDLRNNANPNQSLYSGTIATPSSPTSFGYLTHAFTSPITLTSGQTYLIILRTTAGNNNNSYRAQVVSTTNAPNFTSITYDGTNSVYSTSGNGGGSWTDNNQSDIGGFYFAIQTSGGYAPSGDFTSHQTGSFDASSIVAFNNINFNTNVPAGTTLRLQIAINSDNSTWDYFGPDGTNSTYYLSPGSIALNKTLGRYARYKAFSTSNGTATPSLFDIRLNYSP